MAGSSSDPQFNHLRTEFYARFMQVILESRIPVFMRASSQCEDGSTSTSARGVHAPAFNIVLGKGVVLDGMEPWCKGLQDPMVIDILFSRQGNSRIVEGVGQKDGKGAGNLLIKAQAGMAFAESGSEQLILLERWTVEFRKHSSKSLGKVEKESDLQAQKGMIGQHSRGIQYHKLRFGSMDDNHRGRSSGKKEIAGTYDIVEKKMAILLRSVYCTARLLPAQNLSRLLKSSGNCKFKLSYKLTPSPSGTNSKGMAYVSFARIEIHGGHLRVSVAYREKNPSTEHETSSLCPQIIPDYVGRAASLQLKNLPIQRTGQLHSLPLSAQKLSSFKFDNLQLHQVRKKEVATRKLDHAHTVSVGCGGDFSLVEDQGFECPFAINDEQYGNRMESARLRSVKSDTGGRGRTRTHVLGGPSEVYQAFQRPAAPLSSAYQPTKDAASALKELQMYIDLKDGLLK